MSALPDGIALRSDGALWNPRPAADYANMSRRAYDAGYGDGFHGEAWAPGDHGAFSTYRIGFDHGRADAEDQ